MTTSKGLKAVPDIPDDILKKYLAQDEIAIDTELQGLQLRRDQVQLVQLCDRNKNVTLVVPSLSNPPPNLTRLLTDKSVLKVFHYALSDVAFLKTSLGITVHPFHCTKVMSKLIRTYTDQHSLKHLVQEFIGIELDKGPQTSNWHKAELSQEQLKYAANDVIYLLRIYDDLKKMFSNRGKLPSGITAVDMNDRSQKLLPTLVELILNGYGDGDRGWQTSVFNH